MVTLKDGCIASGWKLGTVEGSYLDDEDAFTKDETVYAVSRKHTAPAPARITITVTGDEGYTVTNSTPFEVKKGTP